jgi:hypothetical protein
VRIGRNFQDCLLAESLSEAEREGIARGQLPLAEASGVLRGKVHTDVVRQIRVAADMGLQHVEAQQSKPGLFAAFEPGHLFAMRETARIYGVSLSMHLAEESAAAFLSPGAAGFENLKKEIDAFKILGCECVVVLCPPDFYRGVRAIEDWQVPLKSIQEVSQYALERGLDLRLELPLPNSAEGWRLLEVVEERFSPLKVAPSVAEPADLAEPWADSDSEWPAGLLKYVRVSPKIHEIPGGCLTHRAGKTWAVGKLESLVQGGLNRGTEILVFSGNITEPKDVLDYRDVLAKESAALRDVLEKVASPVRLRRRR